MMSYLWSAFAKYKFFHCALVLKSESKYIEGESRKIGHVGQVMGTMSGLDKLRGVKVWGRACFPVNRQ